MTSRTPCIALFLLFVFLSFTGAFSCGDVDDSDVKGGPPECAVTDDCSSTACYQDNLWCFDNCGDPNHVHTYCSGWCSGISCDEEERRRNPDESRFFEIDWFGGNAWTAAGIPYPPSGLDSLYVSDHSWSVTYAAAWKKLYSYSWGSGWKEAYSPLPGNITAVGSFDGHGHPKVAVGKTLYKWDSSTDSWVVADGIEEAPGEIVAIGDNKTVVIGRSVYRHFTSAPNGEPWERLSADAPGEIAGIGVRSPGDWIVAVGSRIYRRKSKEELDSWELEDGIPETQADIIALCYASNSLFAVVAKAR